MPTYRVVSFWLRRSEGQSGLLADEVALAVQSARQRKPEHLCVWQEGVDPDGWATFTKIPPAEWDALFFASQNEGEAHA